MQDILVPILQSPNLELQRDSNIVLKSEGLCYGCVNSLHHCLG